MRSVRAKTVGKVGLDPWVLRLYQIALLRSLHNFKYPAKL